MEKKIKRYNNAQEDYRETVEAIMILPPRGDGAKDEVARELKQAYDKYIESIRALQKHIEGKYL